MACLEAWVPSKVVAHLRSHGFTVSRDDEKVLLHVLGRLHLVSSESALAPKTLGTPIEGLAIHAGFRCNTCTYCTVKKTSMGKHVCKNAPAGSQFGSPFRTATVQTFWTVLHRHYFEVTAPLPTQPGDVSLLDIYASKLLPGLTTTTQILQPIHPHELPLMVQMTGWHTHLAPYLQDRRLVEDLLDLVQVPTGRSGSRLAKLGDVANDYLQIAGRKISTASFEIRKMLKKYPMYVLLTIVCSFLIFDSSESVHFKPLEDESTIRTYSAVLAKLANAIIKSIDGARNKSGYEFPLSEDDIAHAKALLATLADGVDKNTRVITMHTLVQPMLGRFPSVTESEDGSSKWSRFIECFLALLSVQDDGSFKPCHYMTQPLAILKYLCRITCFIHALGHHDGSGKEFEE